MSNNHETPRIRKRVGEFLVYTIFVLVDAFEFWEKSHLLCLAIALVGLFGVLLIDGLRAKRLVPLMALAVAICALIFEFAPPALLKEAANSGWLIPATDPSPKTACTPDAGTRKADATGAGWFFVTIAGGGVLTVTPTNKLIAVSVDGRPTVVIERSEKGILLDVDMFNPDGTLAVRIEQNAWTTSTAQTFKATRPDVSTLSVVGIHGEELLWVRYMNANTVKLRGTFYRIGDPQPAVITDSSINPGHMQLHMAPTLQAVTFIPCFIVGTSDFRDPILLFR